MAELLNERKLSTIILSFDTDWAPDFILEEIFNMIPQQIKFTVFCTNESEVLKAISAEQVELAIHPNFLPNSTQGSSYDEILNNLKAGFPEALGMRSHRLLQSTPILNLAKEKGISYDSNLYLPQSHLKPFKIWNGMIRFPFFWEDDVNALCNKSWDVFDLFKEINFKGLKIFNFHPMFIYLNINDKRMSNYQRLKKYYPDFRMITKEKIKKYINNKNYGNKKFFQQLIEMILSKRIKTFQLKEVYDFLKRLPR